MDPIDLTTGIQFIHLTWIGTGKRFSTTLPLEVYDKKREILKVPDTFPTQFPTSVALVHEFVHHRFPPQSSGLSFHPMIKWFSMEMPVTSPEVLLTRPIPPEEVLKNLDAAIGQMWFDGLSSIVDPRFNNHSERFPLWVLSLWKEAQKLVRNQKRWKSSVCWLELPAHRHDIAIQAKSLIEGLPWNKLLSGGSSTLDFADILGVSWLSDTQINMMVDVLQDRMQTEQHTKGAHIEPLTLAWELESIGNGWKDPLASSYLSRLEDMIQAGTTAIWFPINVNNNHWIAGRVDFENSTFEFGELSSCTARDRNGLLVLGNSMARSGVAHPPGEVLKGLREWFRKRFKRKLMNMGNTLKCPRQTDTYSCSICTMSTIAHGIFKDPLWQQRNASTHRIHWFLTLGEHKELCLFAEPVSKHC